MAVTLHVGCIAYAPDTPRDEVATGGCSLGIWTTRPIPNVLGVRPPIPGDWILGLHSRYHDWHEPARCAPRSPTAGWEAGVCVTLEATCKPVG